MTTNGPNISQKLNFEDVKRLISNFKKDSESRHSLGYFETRLERLREYWRKCEEMHLATHSHFAHNSQLLAQYQQEYENCEVLAMEFITHFKDKIHQYRTPAIAQTAVNDAVRLERVRIPTFDGNYGTWVAFKDLFKSMVHTNANLSNVQKLQYLRSVTKGEAESLINHLSIMDENYETAWKLLSDRYDNNKFIAQEIIQRWWDLGLCQNNDYTSLKRILDTTNQLLASIKNLNLNAFELLAIFVLNGKLDKESKKEWQKQISSTNDVPTLSSFLSFVNKRFTMLESLSLSQSSNRAPEHTNNKKVASHMVQIAKLKCAMCNKHDHKIFECENFRKASVNTRREIAKSKGLCFNCLSEQHKITNCSSKHTCRHCSKRHNTLLHNEQPKLHKKPGEPSQTEVNLYTQTSDSKNHVLLGTAIIEVLDSLGQRVKLRALLDPGSQKSFIRESAVQILGVRRDHAKRIIGGIGGSDAAITKGIVTVEAVIVRKDGNIESFPFSALILQTITSPLPSTYVKAKLSKRLSKIQLADPGYDTPGQIDILLGADLYGDILDNGFIRGYPCAQKTKLGWVLFGSIKEPAVDKSIVSFIIQEDIDKTLRRFWEIEETSSNPQSPKDEEAEQHFINNTRRLRSGRYVVKLPLKDNSVTDTELTESVRVAFIRFRQLERRLEKNPERKQQYHKFIEEYIKLNHLEKVPDNLLQTSHCYYLPHHEVIKESSSTTKLRVVFNASQKAPGGKSLNDCLMVGPAIQNNILHLLMRWRSHKYVIAADIEKMYRQIEVDESDRDYQRIIWRFNSKEPFQHFRLKTVTYGTASAPFLAMRTLQQLAIDEETIHPLASTVILRDFYVDDLLTGADDLNALKNIQRELSIVMKKGGFHLHKWSANHHSLLNTIPLEDREIQKSLNIDLEDEVRALGIQWHPVHDEFSFKVKSIKDDGKWTKRKILSDIAKLFDPLGWLQPVIITGKIAMQKLWLLKVDWDEEVPREILKDWFDTQHQLQLLENLRIPRWIECNTAHTIQLHGFCDASNQAYAATIYLRVERKDKSITTYLLSAKSRVAPIKVISIPRLELCSAVLLIETMKQIKQAYEWNHVKTFFWTDSSIVLSWIQKPAINWKVFVANRISQIHQESSPNQWNHVSTKENPADIASRGMLPEKLLKASLWWKGPQWLMGNKINLSDSALSPEQEKIMDVEQRSVAIVSVTPTPEPEILAQYSSFNKLLRVVALCIRFTNNTRNPTDKKTGIITCDELQKAESCCVRIAQKHAFQSEIQALQGRSEISNSSCMKTLNPWIDSEGLLRVGGRLQHAPISEAAKHPAIIPKGSFAKLIINHYHNQTLHGGNQLVSATIRQKYWIINSQSVIKKVLRECITCYKVNASPNQQLMGHLPPPRFQTEKPFAQTGLDYAGPISIKWSSGRGAKTAKAYIAVFVCMSTKAFHLELVSELTSTACIAAIRRFIARRGKCHTIFSDCGTNFVGANKQLKSAFTHITTKGMEQLAIDGIQWKFIPPGSPHFGGLWEAGVKTVKRHLTKSIGEQLLNIEEMYTLLTQIEACLNSRPLCEVSNDPADLTAITPGHFLTGTNLFEIPEPTSEESIGRKWKLVQQMRKHFWHRWSLEYLNRLQQRPKWTKQRANLNTGDLVLVKHDNFPSTKWPLARIVEVHPGADGIVRVVSVKMHGRVTRRPITKICRLPFENSHPVEASSVSEPQTKSLVTTTKATKRRKVKIAPVNSQWQQFFETQAKRKKLDKPAQARGGGTASILPNHLVISTLMLCCFVPIVLCGVKVSPLSNGLYVEHLGVANLQRGALQVNLNIPWSNLNEDRRNIAAVVKNISALCETGNRVSSEIDCKDLVQHVNELKEEVNHKLDTLQLLRMRNRRGLFGKFLTAVFGINDEVYKDINELSGNQVNLIHTMDMQSRLMLKTMKTLNSTTGRINRQLERFRTQLQLGLDRINKFSVWYRTIDHNTININFIAAYNRALNFVQEVFNKYTNILTTVRSKTAFWECINLSDVTADINRTQTMLPKHLEIILRFSESIQIQTDDVGIKLKGFLPIIDQRKYKLLKVTPIPEHIEDGIFRALDIPTTILGVNYNLQLYFEISDTSILQLIEQRYLASIDTLYDVNKRPNCIINEIYHAFGKGECPVHSFKLKEIVWKKLLANNTWMFVAPQPTHCQTLCHGVRENIVLDGVGIVTMSQDCSLSTKEFILVTEQAGLQSANFSAYVKHIPTTINTEVHERKVKDLITPSIIKASESFSSYVQEEEEIIRKQDSISWKKIGHHSISISISIIISCSAILVYIIIFKKRRGEAVLKISPQSRESRWYEATNETMC